MSQTDPTPEKPAQTTALHMEKFVPAKQGAPAKVGGAEESPTIVIQQAARDVAEHNPQPVVVPKGAGNALPPAEMLGAVSYAYAKGVYRSEDIERKLVQDPAVRSALGDEIPDARTIRLFRRMNRQAIAATLEKFFWWRRKQGSEASAGPAAAAPGQPRESTVCLVKKAAAVRLDQAATVDNVLKDEGP
jgi:hypothetical protein